MARLRLGQILLQAGVCTRENLLEAWEQKVLFGDRLGTNLLSTALIDERTLAQALGHQHGVPAAWGAGIQPQPEALGLLPKPLCVDRSILPLQIRADQRGERHLVCLMRDPDDVPTRREVAALTGLNVVPVVACEARLWQLSARHLGSGGGMRPVPLDEDAEAAWARRRADAAPAPAARAEGGGELVSEEEFESLYMRSRSTEGFPVQEPLEKQVPRAQPPMEAHQTLEVEQTLKGARPEQVLSLRDEEVISVEPASGEGEPAPEERPQPQAVNSGAFKVELPRGVALGEQWHAHQAQGLLEVDEEAARAADPLPTALVGVPLEESGPPPQDFEPLPFADAYPLLDAAHDREEIATIVLRSALSRFRRAALLTVYQRAIVGWKGVPGDFHDAVTGMRFAREAKTVFGFVVSSRAHYIGPLQTWRAHADWVKRTGRVVPRSIAVLPILVRERVVNLLYVDNGHGEHVDSDVGELLILGQRIARSYELLLASARSGA